MRKKDKDTTENLVKLHLRAIYLLKLIVIELMLLLSINFFLTAKINTFLLQTATELVVVSGAYQAAEMTVGFKNKKI
jgi:hypothetical protein